ncbi:hypothetical protein ACA910_004246 [Epithemia clementina (nom. ined.)]
MVLPTSSSYHRRGNNTSNNTKYSSESVDEVHTDVLLSKKQSQQRSVSFLNHFSSCRLPSSACVPNFCLQLLLPNAKIIALMMLLLGVVSSFWWIKTTNSVARRKHSSTQKKARPTSAAAAAAAATLDDDDNNIAAFSLLVTLQFDNAQSQQQFLQEITHVAQYVHDHEPHTLSYLVLQQQQQQQQQPNSHNNRQQQHGPLRMMVLERYQDKDQAYLQIHKSSRPFLQFRPKLQAMANAQKVQITGHSYQDDMSAAFPEEGNHHHHHHQATKASSRGSVAVNSSTVNTKSNGTTTTTTTTTTTVKTIGFMHLPENDEEATASNLVSRTDGDQATIFVFLSLRFEDLVTLQEFVADYLAPLDQALFRQWDESSTTNIINNNNNRHKTNNNSFLLSFRVLQSDQDPLRILLLQRYTAMKKSNNATFLDDNNHDNDDSPSQAMLLTTALTPFSAKLVQALFSKLDSLNKLEKVQTESWHYFLDSCIGFFRRLQRPPRASPRLGHLSKTKNKKGLIRRIC